MKTLLIFQIVGGEDDLQTALLDGDYSRFNNLEVNATEDEALEEDFLNFFYDKEGNQTIALNKGVGQIESKEFDKVAFVRYVM